MSHREIRIIDAMMEHGDAFTRGIASSAISNIERRARVVAVQSSPA
jgi:hypothetical protein